jgi:hypothetical protein
VLFTVAWSSFRRARAVYAPSSAPHHTGLASSALRTASLPPELLPSQVTFAALVALAAANMANFRTLDNAVSANLRLRVSASPMYESE